MPRPTTDILLAAGRCFHFNMAMLIPDYIVIRSPKRGTYAVTTVRLFGVNQAANTADDWQIALNLSSEDLLSLMGMIPEKPLGPMSDDASVFERPLSQPKPEIREVRRDASSPENL